MKTIMYTFAAFTTIAALTSPAWADDDKTNAKPDPLTERAGLIGSWVVKAAPENGGQAWIIDSRPDGLHVTQMEGSGTVADFQCNTMGEACEVKISGHKAKVTMYYNGPALVQLETKGDEVVKRRFEVLPSGAMKVQVTPMTNTRASQTEELEFERRQPSAAGK